MSSSQSVDEGEPPRNCTGVLDIVLVCEAKPMSRHASSVPDEVMIVIATMIVVCYSLDQQRLGPMNSNWLKFSL